VVSTEDLLAAARGIVVAPAGCGKTRLLVDTVLASPNDRTLVLTHTRAGVAVIRSRLSDHSVKSSQCRVATLDNWCGWLASRMPRLSGYVPTGTPRDYQSAQFGAKKVLSSSAIQAAMRATYDRVLVDEYQDCSGLQHEIALALSGAVPMIAFGDPLQRVFDFDRAMPDWGRIVSAFGTTWTLDFPWRWDIVGELAFGKWILRQRTVLEAGGQIDFRAGPPNVRWVQLPADTRQHRQFSLDAVPRPATGTSLFVLTHKAKTPERRDFARAGLRLAVVESAELPDLTTKAAQLQGAKGRNRIELLLGLAHEVMTGVDVSGALARISAIEGGAAATAEERMLLALAGGTDPAELAAALQTLSKGRTVYRPDLMESFCEAAKLASAERTLTEAAAYIRDRRASLGRKVAQRAVGSTLLLKGLEADHTVVIDADSMKATDLYVAISRGARSLTIVSTSPLLPVVR
jgi:hypothetical protein